MRRSLQIYERAKALVPGTTQLISRRPTRAALGVSPIYAERAKGCRIWDVDGNEYIDWTSAVGPVILGYADEVVDAAVRAQIDRGTIYSIVQESAVELAEELVRIVPSAEMVRFCKGGGEACTIAVRIARGVTGRDKVLFCGYHGWHDWYQAANIGAERLASHLFNGIEPIGVPRCLEGTALPFTYGDVDELTALLEAHAGELACIIMEPMRSDEPPPGYLEKVRELASHYGVVLIFDEVSSGFRVALGSAQEYTGVTPDMSVFAKAISNGYPMGAVVGKREFMAPARRCLSLAPIGTTTLAWRPRWRPCASWNAATRWVTSSASAPSLRSRSTRLRLPSDSTLVAREWPRIPASAWARRMLRRPPKSTRYSSRKTPAAA